MDLLHKFQTPLAIVLFAGNLIHATAQTRTNTPSDPVYHIYAGNTHSHTSNTWSHGAQWGNAVSELGESAPKKKGLNLTPDGVTHVSPVSGLDNHGFEGIKKLASRTFVLATNKTKVAILDGMKHRRTYAALDKNIHCRYTVNGTIMGSTLAASNVFNFAISISDPDTTNPKDQITKIDVVKDGGAIVQTYNTAPGYSINWNPVIYDSTNKYFFVRVWSAGGGDTPEANPNIPVAWLAPVWTGR